eukprot:scaffold250610_cov30-Tisochrysis_lutea.AAC.21
MARGSEVSGLKREAVQNTGRGTAGKYAKGAGHPGRFLLHRGVERNRHVAGGGGNLLALIAPHGPFTDLAQEAILSEQGEGARNKIGRQAVQSKTNASTAEQVAATERECAGIARTKETATEAHAIQVEVLVGTAGVRHRTCAKPVQVLAGSKTNTASTSVKKHVVTTRGSRSKERHMHGAPCGRQSTCLLKGERLIDGRKQPRIAPRDGRKGGNTVA